ELVLQLAPGRHTSRNLLETADGFDADSDCGRGRTEQGHLQKSLIGCMERIAIAMQDGGTGAGAWHEAAARPPGPPHFCLATRRLCGPPGRGTFWEPSRREAHLASPAKQGSLNRLCCGSPQAAFGPWRMR